MGKKCRSNGRFFILLEKIFPNISTMHILGRSLRLPEVLKFSLYLYQIFHLICKILTAGYYRRIFKYHWG